MYLDQEINSYSQTAKQRSNDYNDTSVHCTNQQPPQRGGAVPDPVWVWSKWLLAFPRVPSTMGTPLTQTNFSPCCPLNDSRREAHSLSEIGRQFSLFFCLSLTRFLIVLLLMSGNVHPNPGPVFSWSVCTTNVTWRGRSLQWCTCSKWVHLKCSLFYIYNTRLPSLLRPCFFWRSHPYQHCDFSPVSSSLYISTVLYGPPLLMQHSHPTLASGLLSSFHPL